MANKNVSSNPQASAVTAAVSLDRLHTFAKYLEQQLVFGQRNHEIEGQINQELRGNGQHLSRVDIWHVAQQMSTGSPYDISQSELVAIDALQAQKDLYGTLRAIVLTVHHKTGALSGRLGVHVRISSETDYNAETNTQAVMRTLSHVQTGNRMIVMDSVKVISDETKLRAPDIFETNIYGQHRNGLLENHAWNLQRLVRAIREHGYQDRVILMIRLDGPDDGANLNPFNASSVLKYRLAIAKFIRYIETVLPTTPFKLVLGNEPDLPEERKWSDPGVNARTFTFNTFAPAMGKFMKTLAAERPDVTFICPALSAYLKNDQLAYYTAFFGQDRPHNMIPATHGYAADVATLPAGQQNLLEQQAELLRILGRFKDVSGTEIGSGNPLGDIENLSEKGRYTDVAAWILLSSKHRPPPGQDNNWKFIIDPEVDDLTARYLADIVNRSKNRVLRNIRARDGAGLQILQGHGLHLTAYGVAYVAHNTPNTMVAGQTNAVTVTLRNTSYRTWMAGGPNPVRLGYHWYTVDGAEVAASLWDDNRTNLPYDILPDEVVTLQCNLGPPRAPGQYELRWDMVEELRTWFAWQGVPTLNVQVNVNSEDTIPPPPTGISISASHNNHSGGADNLLQAIDNNPYTRWSSFHPQRPGMWFRIDLGKGRQISQIYLDNEQSPRDYPRGYIVRVSVDGQNWTTVAENQANTQSLRITFSPRQARYIYIEQTGQHASYWWSIHGIEISDQVGISATASHNNLLVGADNVSQALDGRPETRWSSRALQRPGMWFEIDLNQIREVNGLALDTAGSPSDYPGGYLVRLSTDRNQWVEVARNAQNNRALDVSFNRQPARYIRIEQTGSATQWWWSIHGVTIRSSEFKPRLTVTASHNNMQSGADNLSQALDGRPETRWSSRTLQHPGMWFEIDLNEIRQINGLALDTARSPNDYPRGYVVQISTDRNRWVEVARNEQNNRALDLNFARQSARYIRIYQIGSTNQWWWSIHGITIKE